MPKRRLAVTVGAPTPKFSPPTPWRPYQREWIAERGRLALCVKSAQIGYSTATVAWALGECLDRDGHLVVVLSRSERQALELMRKAKRLVDSFRGVESTLDQGFFRRTEKLEHSLRFPNGSRIVALSADPDTARGYTGDVVLDEFAFHGDSNPIFQAAYRQITLTAPPGKVGPPRPLAMRVLSTPNGQQGKFWELARALGLDTGLRPPALPVVSRGWSGHWCDVHRAVSEGFPLDVRQAQLGCDEWTWLQEYCCRFLSAESMIVSPQLFSSCVSDQARDGAPPMTPGLFAGWDVARNRDLSVIWFLEAVGDTLWCRGIIEMSDVPTPDQIKEARAWMPFVRRMSVDKTGMGLPIFEALAREFPGQVEGVTFTAANKEVMVTSALMAMQERRVRLPDSDRVRRAFTSIRRSTNKIGQARFDAEHDKIAGHADDFWAFCLAAMAADASAQVARLSEVGAAIGMGHDQAKPIFAGLMKQVL